MKTLEPSFTTLLSSEIYYTVHDAEYIFTQVLERAEKVTNNKKITYYNIPCSFDTESTSFYDNGNKSSVMYVWMFGIDGICIVGRTMDEFLMLCSTLVKVFDITLKDRIIVYVHNLSWDFQFIRKYFEWDKVFCMDSRKICYAVMGSGIEFRCSFLLSGYKLETVGKHLQRYVVNKRVGDLDYTLKRHPETMLTEVEIGYCLNDIKVVMAYIMEEIERNGSIIHIPLTKTGYVRRYCRNAMYTDKEEKSYKCKRVLYNKKIVHNLRLTKDEYLQWKRAFMGGFTHANANWACTTINEPVDSFDETSAYPTFIVSEQFPMGNGTLVEIKDKGHFERCLSCYCCVFDVEFFGLYPKIDFDTYFSSSKCYSMECPVINNGRVVSAKHLITTITNVDFDIVKKVYSWDEMRISNFRRYRKAYLPTDFVRSVLDLYKQKCELKGVPGMEAELLHAKEMLNSTYGMMVMDPVRANIEYIDNDYSITLPDIDKAIDKYNKSQNRFTFYPWGVFVTAYNRRAIWGAILEYGNDYIYSDTDSIKGKCGYKHKQWIDNYNKYISARLYNAMDYHGLPHELVEPTDKKGNKKPLGHLLYEGTYDKFKTLGSKRYLVSHDGYIEMTVSGINKKVATPYLLEKYGPDGIFNIFDNDLLVPAQYTGKMIHTYIDIEQQGTIIDYMGKPYNYHNFGGVHLESCEHHLSLSNNYIEYLKGIRVI